MRGGFPIRCQEVIETPRNNATWWQRGVCDAQPDGFKHLFMEKVFKTLSFHVCIHLKADEFYGARYLTSSAWLVRTRRSCCLLQRSQCLGFSNWSIVSNQVFLVAFPGFLKQKLYLATRKTSRKCFKKLLR